ncbi:hypothetical protein HMPREF0201_01374 [Cedecea davisae DSM 4568]|uniref:Uncharacterized protein n=1 Tax=Cedecea davisae DSM 4568 TaxID=566551 RepID=S3IYG9_9ENTR|nr:hypothetical protein HMPREF0201_01374 [Cedecea davisae DSM 4568]
MQAWKCRQFFTCPVTSCFLFLIKIKNQTFHVIDGVLHNFNH